MVSKKLFLICTLAFTANNIFAVNNYKLVKTWSGLFIKNDKDKNIFSVKQDNMGNLVMRILKDDERDKWFTYTFKDTKDFTFQFRSFEIDQSDLILTLFDIKSADKKQVRSYCYYSEDNQIIDLHSAKNFMVVVPDNFESEKFIQDKLVFPRIVDYWGTLFFLNNNKFIKNNDLNYMLEEIFGNKAEFQFSNIVPSDSDSRILEIVPIHYQGKIYAKIKTVNKESKEFYALLCLSEKNIEDEDVLFDCYFNPLKTVDQCYFGDFFYLIAGKGDNKTCLTAKDGQLFLLKKIDDSRCALYIGKQKIVTLPFSIRSLRKYGYKPSKDNPEKKFTLTLKRKNNLKDYIIKISVDEKNKYSVANISGVKNWFMPIIIDDPVHKALPKKNLKKESLVTLSPSNDIVTDVD